MKKTILALLLTSNANSAFASFIDGNELKKWEKDQNKANFESGLFNGYVVGVIDASNGVLFCTTPGVTRGQISAIAAKHLKNNPEKWNEPASLLIIDAMKDAFPCKP